MELEEMKSAWAQYDKKLNENLKFNEEMLRRANLDRSKREMAIPLNYELFSVITGVLFILFISASTYRFAENSVLLISGILTMLLMVMMLVFSLHRLRLMSSIDYYSSPVLDLQKKLIKVKQQYFIYKRIELIIAPFFILTFIPIGAKAIRNYDILAHPARFMIAFILGLTLGYSLALWVYKNWYEKKIKNTEVFLNELERFEKEE